MRRTGGLLSIMVMISGLCVALMPAGDPVWAKATRGSTPGLWIAADRIVGFVPFTVYVYGKVVGTEPGQLELCRTEAAWLAESANARKVERDASEQQGPGPAARGGASCAAGRLNRTPDGYDYSHDMRFDRPGTYQIRLMMVDGRGERMLSNTVRVRAF